MPPTRPPPGRPSSLPGGTSPDLRAHAPQGHGALPAAPEPTLGLQRAVRAAPLRGPPYRRRSPPGGCSHRTPDTGHRTPAARPPQPRSPTSLAPEPAPGVAAGPGEGAGRGDPGLAARCPQPVSSTLPLGDSPCPQIKISRPPRPPPPLHIPVKGAGLTCQGDPRTCHVQSGPPKLSGKGRRDRERRL